MYKIDRENIRRERNFNLIFGFVGIFMLVIITIILIGIGMEIQSMENSIEVIKIFAAVWLVFFVVCSVLIGIAIKGLRNYTRKMKKLDYLEENGRLVRGLKYSLHRSGAYVNNRPIWNIIADYELESGSIIKLYGDGRFDYKIIDEDGLVDALIDPLDPGNYYIDFNIREEY